MKRVNLKLIHLCLTNIITVNPFFLSKFATIKYKTFNMNFKALRNYLEQTYRIMKKNRLVKVLSIVLLFSLFACYATIKKSNKNQVLMQVLMQELNQDHYAPLELNDQLSEKLFDLYLKRLDYRKEFLVQEDIDLLKKYRDQLDDEIKSGNYEFFNLSIDLIKKREQEAKAYYKEILASPFDFTKDETFEMDIKKGNFAVDKNALKEWWRKYLKYQTMTRLSETMDIQEKHKEQESADILKSGQGETHDAKTPAIKDTTFKVMTFAEMEADARKKVLKNNDEFFKRLEELDSMDLLSSFLNSLANVYDPHTEYFAPKAKANFDIAMSGQLEGIGAQLQERDGEIKITNIVPGSPSARQGILKAGDVILKVAQGSNEPVDVEGMKLDDAVQLIRGKKGTEVRLTVKRVDNSIINVPIIRDVVLLEETYAQSALISNKNKIGYIHLPAFYADFNKRGGRSCFEDMKKEVLKLRKENVDGIVVDLRDNGGGSLQDVVDISGLFIKSGPIVQVKGRNGAPYILEDRDTAVYYDGPLVVMVNTNSASASEIMAAAMQDYKRAIIIGSNQTYGKGTVQRIFNMDDYLKSDYDDLKPLGSVKLTVQKFYRINGGATQLRGVTPDIIVPDAYALTDRGEREQDHPMVWDEIKQANYSPWTRNISSYSKVEANSKQRIQNNASFKLVSQEAERVKKNADRTSYTLNLEKYRKEQKAIIEENKKFDTIWTEIKDENISPIASDFEAIQSDTAKVARNKEWIKNLKKDPYLYEASLVINDLKMGQDALGNK